MFLDEYSVKNHRAHLKAKSHPDLLDGF